MAEESATELTFDRLSYTVQTSLAGKPAGPLDKLRKKTKSRELLVEIKGSVTTGHVLAILGPSGAGKTTLLNMLTLEKKGGKPSGHINVNGEPLTLSMYNERCAYVQQYDSLWAALTVRDHLGYAMELYQPSLNAPERKQAIDKLVKEVGLEESQDVKAGNEFLRGLSGGNKRRLSIALALAKRPSILFLDEPTSGVDSASAVMMMSFLGQIAVSNSIAVVCTIHQPPASVFAGFDNCMILSMGRIAYFGKAQAMGEYFASIGRAPPSGTNLAEFVLDLVNRDFTPVEGVKHVLDKWVERGGEAYGVKPSARAGSLAPVALRAGILTQVAVLARRTLVVAYREPLAYLVRMVANCFCSVFFSIIYIKTRDMTQDQVQARTFYLMFTVGIPMQFILVSVFLYFFQWLATKREVKDGMYHPAASAVASWIVQAPMMFVLAACSLVPAFAIGGLHWPNFPMAWLIYALTLWAFEGLAQLLSVAPNVILGLFNFLNIFFAAFLFCGMFVDVDDVIWPLRLFCYFLPLGWSLQSFVYAVYHGQPESSGTISCTPGTATPTGLICNYQGFYCSSAEDPMGAICYGRTGDQQLNSLGVQFTIFSDEGHIGRNLLLIVAFGILCRVAHAALITLATVVLGGQEPKAPGSTPPPAAQSADTKIAPSSAMPPAAAPAVSEYSHHGARALGECVFSFSDVGYMITPGRSRPWKPAAPPKTVLSNVSATVPDGEVLAIVGPSGAGKTVLLNTLTFANGPGTPFGRIALNGTKLTQSAYTKVCVYVPREDNLWAMLTARQHIEYAFGLYRPQLGADERARAIDQLLASTGMTTAQHTKAGGLLFQGLSGGQRRRLSLAVALVKEPRVIILDEPTSGLDSAAAAAVLTLLRSIARGCNAAIVTTIHQPSAAVFARFQKVLVLAEGRVAYCGERDGMAEHFASIGKPLPTDANPAEAVLDLVSKDISSKEAVLDVLSKWAEASRAKAPPAAADPRPPTAEVALSTPASAAASACSPCASALVVLRRTAYLALVDPTVYLVRLVMAPFLVAFFGLVYKESADEVQTQVPFRLFYLWWVLAVPPCLNIISVIVLSFETRSVISEMKNGMYGPLAYALSTALISLPMLLLLSLLINVCSFAIGGWPWDQFLTAVLMYASNLFVFEGLGQLLAVIFRNPIVGMLAFMMAWSTSIIFCGLVFRGDDVIWPFRLFYYIMPMRWLFNGNGYDVYYPSTYSGAENCVPGSAITTAQGPGICQDAGFFCYDASSSLGCYGREGPQILDTLHLTYESLGSEDYRAVDFAILLGMAVIMKAAHTAALWRAMTSSKSPKDAAPVAVSSTSVA